MFATNFDIVQKRRPEPVGLVDLKDFELRECGEVDAREILLNERISLYAFDFENARAVFVETITPAELSLAPFLYQAQYENATRVFTLPFESMIGLARSISLNDTQLIFIHSTGRCGSTLAGRLLAQVSGVVNLSEPDALTQLVIARFLQPDQKDMIKMLLDASIRLLCKAPAATTAWVIKGRSWVIELADWLYELYPHAKNLYLYREAESWIKSNLSAFGDSAQRTPEQWHQSEAETRGWMKFVVPSIAHFDPDQHLSFTGLTSLMWLDNLQRYMELHQAGIRMLAIPYSHWKQNPRRTALAMLEYCELRVDDLSVIEETLSRDSQEGSAVSQDVVKTRTTSEFFNREELNRFLQAHPYIHTPDFAVANILKI